MNGGGPAPADDPADNSNGAGRRDQMGGLSMVLEMLYKVQGMQLHLLGYFI